MLPLWNETLILLSQQWMSSQTSLCQICTVQTSNWARVGNTDRQNLHTPWWIAIILALSVCVTCKCKSMMSCLMSCCGFRYPGAPKCSRSTGLVFVLVREPGVWLRFSKQALQLLQNQKKLLKALSYYMTKPSFSTVIPLPMASVSI